MSVHNFNYMVESERMNNMYSEFILFPFDCGFRCACVGLVFQMSNKDAKN